MNRRDFLMRVAAGFVTAAAAPLIVRVPLCVQHDAVYWAGRGWSSGNSMMTAKWVTKETARMFAREVQSLARVNRAYDAQYLANDRARVGNTVRVRLPERLVL